MRILWFSTRFPYPPKGGDLLLTYKHLQGLSKWADVFLFSLDEFSDHSKKDIESLKLKTGVSEIKNVDISKKNLKLGAIKTFFTSIPAQCFYYKNEYALNAFKAYVQEVKPNVVIFQTVRSYFYFLSVHNVPKIIHFVDAISHNYSVALPRVAFKTKLIYKNEIPKLLKVEEELSVKSNAGIFVSKRDIDWLKNKGISSDNFFVIPNGTDVEYFSYKAPKFDSKKIVFFGNMRTVANHDAAMYLINDIFPRLKENYPDSELWFVGANPRKKLMIFDGKDGIHVTGAVDDLRPYIWDSRIAVSPIRIGAGMQNKIMEAAALGTPQVISTLAYKGLSFFEDGRDFLVANNKGDFVKKISNIFEDKELALSLSKNARKIVEDNYTWEKSWSNMKECIKKALS